jgi:acyl-homoserine-lactone acylase
MTSGRPLFALIAAALLQAACVRPAEAASSREILWDTWGVPHIYGETLTDAFYLLGWAQARAHANTLAVSMGKATGRAAEHWGESSIADDSFVHQLGLAERSAAEFAADQGPYRERLLAFAAGINAYVSAHPEAVAAENRWVFPVDPALVIAHNARLFIGFLLFEADLPAIEDYVERAQSQERAPRGSNGFAIAPKRSASGSAMLVINPHLDWSGEFLFFESHIVAGGIDAYGASLVGQPFLSMGFTPALGWTHTVNPADGADTYELSLRGDGYRYDGKTLPFERAPDVTLKVRGADGAMSEHVIERRRSIHGPVVYFDAGRGKALALRITGHGAGHTTERFWSLLEARNLAEFEAVNRKFPLPFFNTVYADRDGHILYQYNADLPDRKAGEPARWRGIVPGDRSEYLWTRTLPITEMPRVVDPEPGFLQNSNDPPWSSTFPWALNPAKFSRYLPAPAMDFRAQSITKNLLATPKLSFEELVRQKNANRVEMADRFLPALLVASERSKDPVVLEARKTLAAWDRHVNPQSRGAVLFLEWVEAMGGTDGDWFETPWNQEDPLRTPRGIKSPEKAVLMLAKAAQDVRDRHGAVDVPFGDVYRMRLGGKDVPARVASVYYGIAPDGGFSRADDGKRVITGGDTFVAVVEFSNPQRAEGLLPYGNSSQPGSPHVGDQLELFSQGKLRPLWRERGEIERHLELREQP